MRKLSDDSISTKPEWSVTQTAFDRLLEWLDPDRDRAGEKYEHIRRSLTKIFISRGYPEADLLTDQTIDRVAKLNLEHNLTDNYTGSPMAYFVRVARYISQEYGRKKLDPRQSLHSASSEEIEPAHDCLERCLQRLATEDRDVVLQYYRGEKGAKISNRKEMAKRLGLSHTALRVKAHRLRLSLQGCIEDCLERY